MVDAAIIAKSGELFRGSFALNGTLMAKDKPYYPHNPIGSVDSLAKTLGCAPKILRDLTRDTSNSYTCFSISTKKGKEREVYEPKYELK